MVPWSGLSSGALAFPKVIALDVLKLSRGLHSTVCVCVGGVSMGCMLGAQPGHQVGVNHLFPELSEFDAVPGSGSRKKVRS